MREFARIRWVVDAGVFLVTLLLAVCSALGQTVTDIETRGTNPTHGEYKVLRGGEEAEVPTQSRCTLAFLSLTATPYQSVRRTTTK